MLILIAFFGIFCFAFGGCPSNSIGLRLNASICYSFHPSLSQYAIAERECNSFGANLVTLNNKYTNVYVTQLANLFFKHLETEEFWTNGHRLMDTKTFRWINGDEIAYDNLLNSHTENDQDCMTVNLEKGFWKHENCFTRLPFVCEFVGDKKEVPPTAIIFETFESFGAFVPLRLKNQFIAYVLEKTIIPPSAATTIIEPTTTKPKTCPPSWTYNNVTGYCYNVFHDKSITWMEAEQKCVQEQSHLASVHNKDEVAFVAELAELSSLFQNSYHGQIYVGFFTDDNEETWKWTDGTPMDYLKWSTGEPNFSPGYETCGTMWGHTSNTHTKFGDFNNFPCNQKIPQNFVCKKLPH